jgi:NADH-quinone oxidoreductase subunit N
MDATALLQSTGALLPHLTILVTGLVILALDLFLTPRSRYLNEVVALLGILLAFLFTLQQTGEPRPAFLNMAVADNLGAFFSSTFLLIALLTVLMSAGYVRREDINAGEYYALVLFATTGFMFVAAAADLVVLFLAIETLSIATYILAGLQRQEPRSQEAAFKYFILGAFSSAFFLYGIATIYGAQGHTNLLTLGQTLATSGVSPLTLLGMGLLMVGLGFKAAVVPFHMWAPDVYEGAPTAVTAFMTAGPKAAAFAAFLRVFLQGFGAPDLAQQWVPIFAVLAALTMIVGNVVAITQQSLKRMLAYSSIAHAGYAFVALVAQSALGASSLLYYLMAYALMSLGSFAVLQVVTKPGDQRHVFDDYAGLGTTYPWLAAAMSLFMFALAGFPPTAGFAGKFYIFSAAVQSGHYWLALIGVLTSVVSVVYYARVVIMMYMHAPSGEPQVAGVAPTTLALLGIAAFGTLYLGLFPGGVLRLAERAVQVLF